MRRAADVKSIDALKAVKTALVEFREVISLSLSESSAEVQRTLWWLQNDALMYWKQQVKKRSEKVNQARSEVYRAKLTALDSTHSALEQKKLLERAERGLQEAEEKVRLVQKWARILDREMMLFKAACQPLARAVEGEIPRGEARLEHLADSLQKYVSLTAPRGGPKEVQSEAAQASSTEPKNESSASSGKAKP